MQLCLLWSTDTLSVKATAFTCKASQLNAYIEMIDDHEWRIVELTLYENNGNMAFIVLVFQRRTNDQGDLTRKDLQDIANVNQHSGYGFQ